MRAIVRVMREAKVGREDVTRCQGVWLRSYMVDLFGERDTDGENLDYSRLALLSAVTATETALPGRTPI